MADVRVTSIQKIVDVAPDADLQLGGIYGLVDYAADTTIQLGGVYGLVDYSVPANLELGGIYLLVDATIAGSSPDPVVINFTAVTLATVEYEIVQYPAPLPLAFTVPAATISSKIERFPDPVVFQLTVLDPTIEAIADQRPNPVAIKLTLTAPTVSYALASITAPDPVQIELTVVSPAVASAVEIVAQPNPVVIRFTPTSVSVSSVGTRRVRSRVLLGSAVGLKFTTPSPTVIHTAISTVSVVPVVIEFAPTTSFDFQLEIVVDSYVFSRPLLVQFTTPVTTYAHTVVSFEWADSLAIDFTIPETDIVYEVVVYLVIDLVPGSFGIYFTIPDPVVSHDLVQSTVVDPVRVLFDSSISEDGVSWVFADTVAVLPVRFRLRFPSIRLTTVPPSDVDEMWPPLLVPNSYFH